ncbi:hypothetical protein C8T65DRAFT_244809 [Cerioporus squamosus]|nr:hypothetical protein C8T65DRAFT_244809 [Cerioporus squamosus]
MRSGSVRARLAMVRSAPTREKAQTNRTAACYPQWYPRKVAAPRLANRSKTSRPVHRCTRPYVRSISGSTSPRTCTRKRRPAPPTRQTTIRTLLSASASRLRPPLNSSRTWTVFLSLIPCRLRRKRSGTTRLPLPGLARTTTPTSPQDRFPHKATSHSGLAGILGPILRSHRRLGRRRQDRPGYGRGCRHHYHPLRLRIQGDHPRPQPQHHCRSSPRGLTDGERRR